MVTHLPSLKERQRQEREQLILQAAEESLLERGYHDTSVDDIAARVGVSKGTVYQHFPSKEDLILALFGRALRAFLAAVDATLAVPASPREKLAAIIEQAYGALSGKHIYLLGTLAQTPELLKRVAEKRGVLEATIAELEARLAALLEEGKAAGEFDAALPTPVMLSMLTSVLAPHSYRRLVVRAGMPPDEAIAHMTRFYFKGLAADEPRADDGAAR